MYTHPKQIVNAIYGGSELLMFDIDKVITAVEFEVLLSVDSLLYWTISVWSVDDIAI